MVCLRIYTCKPCSFECQNQTDILTPDAFQIPSFTSHLHTEYSFLGGAVRMRELMKNTAEFG